jgi:hypothetical protein
MNNIYVDELPKSCEECDFCEYFGKDAHGKGQHEVACWFNGFLTNALLGDIIEAKHCTHLKSLTDRLTEERKKVVQEIKKLVIESTCYDTEEEVRNQLYDMSAGEVLKILDQIEIGE